MEFNIIMMIYVIILYGIWLLVGLWDKSRKVETKTKTNIKIKFYSDGIIHEHNYATLTVGINTFSCPARIYGYFIGLVYKEYPHFMHFRGASFSWNQELKLTQVEFL